MQRFEGKVVAITGGGAGIGAATARRITREGGRVALLDWSAPDLERTLAALREAGAECAGLTGDVADPAASQALVDLALERFGRLDALVANAGVRAYGTLFEATEEDWQRVLSVNLRGVVNSCLPAARAMKRGRNGGALVLLSSIAAYVGRADMPIYDATKAALLSITRSLAVDLAPDGIRVNSVCPGFTVTDFHVRRAQAHGRTAADLRSQQISLLRRPADPDEIASVIAFLASDDASYMTATNLMVDGGRHAT